MNETLWCLIGVTACCAVTCVLACVSVRRAGLVVDEYAERVLDLEDEVVDLKAIRRSLLEARGALIDERNELRARLTRSNPRDARGRFA